MPYPTTSPAKLLIREKGAIYQPRAGYLIVFFFLWWGGGRLYADFSLKRSLTAIVSVSI